MYCKKSNMMNLQGKEELSEVYMLDAVDCAAACPFIKADYKLWIVKLIAKLAIL